MSFTQYKTLEVQVAERSRPAGRMRPEFRASRYTYRMRLTLSLIAAGLLSVMMGCGQKGPLVLPDAQRPHKKIGIGKPAQPAPAQPAAPGAQPPTPGTPTPAGAAPSTSSTPAPAEAPGAAAAAPQP